MILLHQLITSFSFILILTVGIGQEITGCMDDGYQQWSPNFGSPACNYEPDAIVEGECLYNDCLGCCPTDNCTYIGNGDGLDSFGIDECGECDGDNSCLDCAEIPYGTAYEDACGTCVSGNTGNSDTLRIQIDSTFLKIGSSVQNYKIPVNVSNVGPLYSFYMELDYNSTYIQVINSNENGIDINNNNYNELVHYDTIINNTSFDRRVIFNSIYNPDSDEILNPFSTGCDSTDVIFEIKLNTSVVIDTISTSISIHNLVLNENPLDIIEVWPIIISNPQGCSDEEACNAGEEGSCEYAEANHNCDGNCIATGEGLDENGLDCNDDCGGSAYIDDDCEICIKGNTGQECIKNCAESAEECTGDNHIWDGTDCWNGDAYKDFCGNCIVWPGDIDCSRYSFNVYNSKGNMIENDTVPELDIFYVSLYMYPQDSLVGIDLEGIDVKLGFDTDILFLDDNDWSINPDSLNIEGNLTGELLAESSYELEGGIYSDGQCVRDDEGDESLPECMSDCIGIEVFIPDIITYNTEFCNWFANLWATGLDEDDPCFDDCDEATYTELSDVNTICTECIPEGDCDCAGVPNGDAEVDECGVCNGNGLPCEDCNQYSQDNCDDNAHCKWEDDTKFRASIYAISDEFYQGDSTNILFLQFSSSGTYGDSTLINYNEIRINDNPMKEENYTSKMIYFGEALSINESLIPQKYTLSQNYPNPFNPITYIHYSISNYDFITMDIINISGQTIKTIVHSSHQPGNYEIMWDGTNSYGIPAPSGIYFYKMDADKFVSVKKLVLLK